VLLEHLGQRHGSLREARFIEQSLHIGRHLSRRQHHHAGARAGGSAVNEGAGSQIGWETLPQLSSRGGQENIDRHRGQGVEQNGQAPSRARRAQRDIDWNSNLTTEKAWHYSAGVEWQA
jgi:hypothetical protein